MIFVYEKDNRIEKTTTLQISLNQDALLQNMKDDYYSVHSNDKKNKKKHQFSQSRFSDKFPSCCMIFYHDQTRIEWELREHSYNAYADFIGNVNVFVNATVQKFSSIYRSVPKIDIIACDSIHKNAIVKIYW